MIQTLSLLDQKFLLILNSWNAEWLNPYMVLLSSQIIWIPFIFFILYFGFKQLTRQSFYLFVLFLLLAVIASDVSSSYLLKNIFQRLRPCRIAEIKELMNNFGQKCGGKFGFVSSHAANSVCLIVFASLVLHFKTYKFHLIWILPILVCFSRVYLGVHYPGDILGGAAVGALWGGVLAWFFKHHQSRGQTA